MLIELEASRPIDISSSANAKVVPSAGPEMAMSFGFVVTLR
jgi:hypothetical protein